MNRLTKIDAELGFPQFNSPDLTIENWTKNFHNDNAFINATGSQDEVTQLASQIATFQSKLNQAIEKLALEKGYFDSARQKRWGGWCAEQYRKSSDRNACNDRLLQTENAAKRNMEKYQKEIDTLNKNIQTANARLDVIAEQADTNKKDEILAKKGETVESIAKKASMKKVAVTGFAILAVLGVGFFIYKGIKS